MGINNICICGRKKLSFQPPQKLQKLFFWPSILAYFILWGVHGGNFVHLWTFIQLLVLKDTWNRYDCVTASINSWFPTNKQNPHTHIVTAIYSVPLEFTFSCAVFASGLVHNNLKRPDPCLPSFLLTHFIVFLLFFLKVRQPVQTIQNPGVGAQGTTMRPGGITGNHQQRPGQPSLRSVSPSNIHSSTNQVSLCIMVPPSLSPFIFSSISVYPYLFLESLG